MCLVEVYLISDELNETTLNMRNLALGRSRGIAGSDDFPAMRPLDLACHCHPLIRYGAPEHVLGEATSKSEMRSFPPAQDVYKFGFPHNGKQEDLIQFFL